MTFQDWLSKNWVLAIGILIVISLVFAYLQNIIILQIQYFAIFLGVVFLAIVLSNAKSSKKLKLIEARDFSKPIIEEFKPHGTKLEGIYKVNSMGELDIPKEGAYRIDFGGSPRSIIYIDSKTGEPFAYQGDVSGIKSPIETPKTPEFRFKYPKIKEKTEREIKPQE